MENKELYMIYLENKSQILINRLYAECDVFKKAEIENELVNIENQARLLANKINAVITTSKSNLD